MDSLTGKIALVTGASRGVGRGVALGLAEFGATVYITGRTVAGVGSLEETVAEADALHGSCRPIECDHLDDAASTAAVARVVDAEGRLDILVNCAWGGYENMLEDGEFTYANPFWEQPIWRWDAMFTGGVRVAFVCSRAAARQMVAQRSGLIVNVSSFAGHHYEANAIYGTAKCAIDRLTADMALELAPHEVAAVALYPGLVRTEKVLEADFFDLSNSESPQFSGRAVAHLALDSHVLDKSGTVVVAAELAMEYGFTDIDGKQPQPLHAETD